MHPLISSHQAHIARICRQHGIRRLEVFGSAARAVDFDPATSDADFLVEFDPVARRGFDGYYAFKAELEKLLDRDVDLVEPGALRNPYLLSSIDGARELVYAA